MNPQARIISHSESYVEVNSVIRNTYILLSLTLLFSAVTAFFSVVTHAGPTAGLISMLASFGLLFVTQALRNSVWGLLAVFGFTGLMGYGLGPALSAILQTYANGPQLIMTSLGLTGLIFFALSAYVMTSRKDFSFMGGFLFVALILGVMASLVGLFFPMPLLQLILSALFALVFCGFILFDTSRIIHGGERNYIMATISLYLDIYNLFIQLLTIISALAGRRD